MTTETRQRLSTWLFRLALPVTLLILAVGWTSEAWRLAYPVGMAFVWAGWWVAPATAEKRTAKKGRTRR